MRKIEREREVSKIDTQRALFFFSQEILTKFLFDVHLIAAYAKSQFVSGELNICSY